MATLTFGQQLKQTALVFALGLGMVCIPAHPSRSEAASINLDRDQSILLGRELLADNKTDIALALARALIARDPQDPDALVLMAAALQQSGKHKEARKSARDAFTASTTEHQKYESAMLVGRSDFHGRAYMRSQYWLRRAAQAAPDPQARQAAERNFRYVKRVNPLRLRFSAGVKSSSNVNGGTSADTINLFGLPFQINQGSRALSGTEYALDFDLRYRLAQTKKGETALTAEMESRTYSLSSDSRRKAPNARASDYSFQRMEVGLARRFTPGSGKGVYEIAGAVGRIWYGGKTTSDYTSLSLSHGFQLFPATGARLSFSVDRQIRHNSAARAAYVYELEGQVAHEFSNKDRMIFLGSLKQTDADVSYIRNTALSADLIYSMAKPVFGVRFSPTVGLEQRRYPDDIYQNTSRRDLTKRLGIAASFDNVEYLGFSPTLHVEFSDTESNVSIHERQSLDVFLKINSRF
ncbi:surface lipoprotein assembly modifier [Rhodobacteraceae bacterium KMM 6894]|nr:surface lipoprotein assembly modifier [Rhodobacteraceae bacterium KMM 6894]